MPPKVEKTLFEAYQDWKWAYFPYKYPLGLRDSCIDLLDQIDRFKKRPSDWTALISTLVLAIQYGERLKALGVALRNEDSILGLPDDLEDLVWKTVEVAMVHAS